MAEEIETSDLPVGSFLDAPAEPVEADRGRRRFVLPALILTIAVVAGTMWSLHSHVPPFFLFPLAFFLLSRRRGFAFGQPRAGRGSRRR